MAERLIVIISHIMLKVIGQEWLEQSTKCYKATNVINVTK